VVTAAEPVVREIEIEASPETIFRFLVEPDHMVRWKGTEAELHPVPGGLYRVKVTHHDIARGHYVEIVPNERVIFTWGWEAEGHPVPPGDSTVTIELEPRGSTTLVRLTHSGLDANARRAHLDGWEHYLPRLQLAASGRDPGLDPWLQEQHR